jgi:hypothetical protein
VRRVLLRGNRDFHSTTLQCGLPGLVSPPHSLFVIVLELSAFLLRRRTSFLAQVVTLTGPREPGRNCQTPTPPPLGFPSLCGSANPEVALPPLRAFLHQESSCMYSFIRFLLYSLLPSSKVASHKQSQSPKAKKKQKVKKAMERSLEPR